MANSLNRDIAENEEVIIKADLLKPEYAAIDERVFVVTGAGFGMHSFTSGTALYGHFKVDDPNDTTRLSGYDIDAKETAQWQAEHSQANSEAGHE